MLEQFLWVEKYRPKTIEETILPIELKTTFKKFIDDGSIPNLILSGTAGIGKTTTARAMLEEIEADYIIINGSNEGRLIDTLRNIITSFASTVFFNGGRKYTYGVRDVEQFTAALTQVITSNDSVGRFINKSIKSEDLVTV